MSYRCAAAGVEEKVGSVGSNRRLVGDWPVAQSHANNGSHVGLCAKHMDGDPSGLSWKPAEIQMKHNIFPTGECLQLRILSVKTHRLLPSLGDLLGSWGLHGGQKW